MLLLFYRTPALFGFLLMFLLDVVCWFFTCCFVFCCRLVLCYTDIPDAQKSHGHPWPSEIQLRSTGVPGALVATF